MTSPRDVFINCPFDEDFDPGFRALIFSVLACGFRARCAREMDDATETRLEKLYRIIEQCRFGLHDLSRTELDEDSNLPRFNMPLELGLFLGAKRFGGHDQRHKRCLIFDVEQYRYQRFISDLNGMDITPHGGAPRRMAECARNWLATVSRRQSIPTAGQLTDSFDRFFDGLPEIAQEIGLDADAIIYPDFERLVLHWVQAERDLGNLP